MRQTQTPDRTTGPRTDNRSHLDATAWAEMRKVVAGPLPDIAERFSRFLSEVWSHEAEVVVDPEHRLIAEDVADSRAECF